MQACDALLDSPAAHGEPQSLLSSSGVHDISSGAGGYAEDVEEEEGAQEAGQHEDDDPYGHHVHTRGECASGRCGNPKQQCWRHRCSVYAAVTVRLRRAVCAASLRAADAGKVLPRGRPGLPQRNHQCAAPWSRSQTSSTPRLHIVPALQSCSCTRLPGSVGCRRCCASAAAHPGAAGVPDPRACCRRDQGHAGLRGRWALLCVRPAARWAWLLPRAVPCGPLRTLFACPRPCTLPRTMHA